MTKFKEKLIELIQEEIKIDKSEIDEHVVADFFCYTYPEPLRIIAQENYLQGYSDCYEFIVKSKEFLK